MWGFVKSIGRGIKSAVRGVVRGLHEVLGGIGWLGHRLIGIPELLGSLAGIRFTKKFRLKVLILPDLTGTPLATTAAVDEVVDEAKRIFYRNRMKVRIIPLDDEQAIVSHYSGSVPDYVRRPECGVQGWLERYKGKGRWYARQAARYRGDGCAVVFVVDDVHEGDKQKNGCFLNLIDYGYIDSGALRPPNPVPTNPPRQPLTSPGAGRQPVQTVPAAAADTFPPGTKMTLAHELGHACDLLHRTRGGRTPGNLMRPSKDERTQHLTSWQVAVIRSSRRVRYT
jgi:hypothetical protein